MPARRRKSKTEQGGRARSPLTCKSGTSSFPRFPTGESRDTEVTVERKLEDSVRWGEGDKPSRRSLRPSPIWFTCSRKVWSSFRKAFILALMVPSSWGSFLTPSP